MSSAHRPTWTPAMGKDARLNTKQYSSRDIAGHTKLKFRQPGQNSQSDISRRDLKLELELAERDAIAKKRRAAGLLPIEEHESKKLMINDKVDVKDNDDEEVRNKRRKILEEALIADKDDSDSEDESVEERKRSKKVGKGIENKMINNGSKVADTRVQDDDENSSSDDSDDDDDDDDDDENETAELLKELEKIKRERAEEKARQEQERATTDALDKEASAAMGNPLLNLKAALGNTSPTNSISTSTSTSFSIKKRWDDDVIFKNQARDVNEKPKKEFVNDLLRTEFHRRFLKKFIA
ncbi:hypothetical protein CROQUDRAFT_90340 [Cronartium quercuum f. sp. fusiforme G11]|uniref:Cwf15/Cwc15 cell cycle control protein n=1 Tax=Cronartium quercuum f. sp. fusiforme G11 TaxID=708437 RepID=A0A9P6NRV5_9BASI|nr:hypothetical protein CROQUDRAFT_90340 [Cronartium quercuum f. sp. fusiforme G11]